MNDTDKIAMLFRKIDDLAARHQAREALFEHLTVPIYLAVIPHALAVELIAAARTFDVKLPDGPQKLLIEEHINAIVDRLERKLRSKVERRQ